MLRLTTARWRSSQLPDGAVNNCPMAQFTTARWRSSQLPDGAVHNCPMAQFTTARWRSSQLPDGAAHNCPMAQFTTARWRSSQLPDGAVHSQYFMTDRSGENFQLNINIGQHSKFINNFSQKKFFKYFRTKPAESEWNVKVLNVQIFLMRNASEFSIELFIIIKEIKLLRVFI